MLDRFVKKRFEFEFKTSVVTLNGNHVTVLIFVYDVDDFEAWDPDRDIPIDLDKLPEIDRLGILALEVGRGWGVASGGCAEAARPASLAA